jgi:hypothetical protein
VVGQDTNIFSFDKVHLRPGSPPCRLKSVPQPCVPPSSRTSERIEGARPGFAASAGVPEQVGQVAQYLPGTSSIPGCCLRDTDPSMHGHIGHASSDSGAGRWHLVSRIGRFPRKFVVHERFTKRHRRGWEQRQRASVLRAPRRDASRAAERSAPRQEGRGMGVGRCGVSHDACRISAAADSCAGERSPRRMGSG